VPWPPAGGDTLPAAMPISSPTPVAPQEPNLFVGWSGPRSHPAAEAFHGWIKSVVQAARPWIASESIRKGAMWRNDLTQVLRNCGMGVSFVTRDTLAAPWLLFESGSLCNSVGAGLVGLVLLDLKPSDLDEPLSAFQLTSPTQKDMRKLVLDINATIGDPTAREAVGDVFDAMWPRLEPALAPPPAMKEQPPRRSLDDALEMLIDRVASMEQEIGRWIQYGQWRQYDQLLSRGLGNFGDPTILSALKKGAGEGQVHLPATGGAAGGKCGATRGTVVGNLEAARETQLPLCKTCFGPAAYSPT
jgi:hypothetical protein